MKISYSTNLSICFNDQKKRQRFKVNNEGAFALTDGGFVANPNNFKGPSVLNREIKREQLIPDKNGAFYRNWRPEIKSPNDIWNEIVKVTRLPGVTSAPKLQPIETRLVMLQTGMRAPMGIKVKGQESGTNRGFWNCIGRHFKRS